MTKKELRQIAQKLAVTDHMDYRSWLVAVFLEAKKRDASYSYTKLSDDLGLGSSNAHLVLNGRRDLTGKTGEKVAIALGLTGLAKRFFLGLIAYQHAKTTATREEAFEKLLGIKARLLPTALDRAQLAFFADWFNAAILELLRLPDAQDDPEWIAAKLVPRVSLPQVKKSLELLQTLKYVAPDKASGRLVPTDKTISTGNEAVGMAIASFHEQMIDLAKHAIDKVAAEEREISSLTLAVPHDLKSEIKQEIIALRKRLINRVNEQEHAEEVIQLNFQMFPLTGVGEKS